MAKDEELPFPDLQQKLAELSTRRYIDVLRNRVNDLNQKLGTQPYFDQYPGKTQPFIFSKLYGPFGLTSARRSEPVGRTAFEQYAPTAAAAEYLVPRHENILTGRIGSFYWCSTQVTGYISWTYVSDPEVEVYDTSMPVPIDPREPGDIFDSVIGANGGACTWNQFASTDFSQKGSENPLISFDMALYDKKRGRYLGDGKIPGEMFCSGRYGPRKLPEPIRFDPDSELEPRVFINEVKMGSFLDTDQAYTAARVACYLNVCFKGYFVSEEPGFDGAWFQSVASRG